MARLLGSQANGALDSTVEKIKNPVRRRRRRKKAVEEGGGRIHLV